MRIDTSCWRWCSELGDTSRCWSRTGLLGLALGLSRNIDAAVGLMDSLLLSLCFFVIRSLALVEAAAGPAAGHLDGGRPFLHCAVTFGCCVRALKQLQHFADVKGAVYEESQNLKRILIFQEHCGEIRVQAAALLSPLYCCLSLLIRSLHRESR